MKISQAPSILPDVINVIKKLNEKAGSTTKVIINQILDAVLSSKSYPKNITMQVRRALKFGVENDLITQWGGRFKIIPKSKIPRPSKPSSPQQIRIGKKQDNSKSSKPTTPVCKKPENNSKPSSSQQAPATKKQESNPKPSTPQQGPVNKKPKNNPKSSTPQHPVNKKQEDNLKHVISVIRKQKNNRKPRRIRRKCGCCNKYNCSKTKRVPLTDSTDSSTEKRVRRFVKKKQIRKTNKIINSRKRRHKNYRRANTKTSSKDDDSDR